MVVKVDGLVLRVWKVEERVALRGFENWVGIELDSSNTDISFFSFSFCVFQLVKLQRSPSLCFFWLRILFAQ